MEEVDGAALAAEEEEQLLLVHREAADRLLIQLLEERDGPDAQRPSRGIHFVQEPQLQRRLLRSGGIRECGGDVQIFQHPLVCLVAAQRCAEPGSQVLRGTCILLRAVVHSVADGEQHVRLFELR